MALIASPCSVLFFLINQLRSHPVIIFWSLVLHCSSRMAPPSHNRLFACDSWGKKKNNNVLSHIHQSIFLKDAKYFCFPVVMKDAFFGQNSDSRTTLNAQWVDYESMLQIACLSLSYLFTFKLCTFASFSMRQKCKLINLFLRKWSRVIIPELNKSLARGLLPSDVFIHTFLSNAGITHGLILLENLFRRIRAMVVRTAMVVHMVLTPATSGLRERRRLRAPRPLPLEGSWLFLSSLLALNHGWEISTGD